MNLRDTLEGRGGFHPPILSAEVEAFLMSPSFYRRLSTMKVGSSIRVPYAMGPNHAKAFQERIWRLNERGRKEFRTFKSKKTGYLFIFRIA